MISELIKNDFGIEEKEDYSCSESILYGANIKYKLGLDKESLKMAAGFSSGAYTGNLCGAVSASAMVLAKLFSKDRAHADDHHKNLIIEMVTRFEEKMKSPACSELKPVYKELDGCKTVILCAAEILDDIIQREL